MRLRHLAIPIMTLLLLSGCAYYHVVESGDTLYDMSREYGVSVNDIQEANPGIDPYNLQIGQKVKIPRFPDQHLNDFQGGNRRLKPTPTPRPYYTPNPSVEPTPPPYQEPTPRPQQRTRFIWPVQGGHIAARYGDSRDGVTSHGLDIEAPLGTPVRAAESGTVLLASDRFKGYGNMVIIKHSGGLVSIYAHNRVNKVKKDDQVKRGQIIAEVGQTGRVDRPTLHFEIRIGSQAVDPLGYLPSR